ncbi:MAG: D-sedoheptulose 7-phosphate isomerase [Desulfonatronovibrionaceae bacterium]
MSEATEIINRHSLEGSRLREDFFSANSELLIQVAKTAAVCLARGGKLMFCGNGGSAADAQHLAAEFVNRFRLERPPLPALALTTDTSVLTAVGNDYSFNEIFAKQIKALGREGDMLFGISTSGNSPNVREALVQAREMEILGVGLLGGNGGPLLEFCHFALIVPGEDTPLIQEVHIAAGHMLCHLVDYFLFEAVSELDL